MKINKKDLIIEVELEEAVAEQVKEKIQRLIYEKVTVFSNELYEEAEKIADEITPKYTKQVIESIKRWMKEPDSQSTKPTKKGEK